MGIIKHRPVISLLVDREIVVGGSHQATVVVDARREVPIDWLRITLRGAERGTVGAGEHQTTKRLDFLNLQAELAGARVLPAGRAEFPVRFDLPDTAPPSYRGRRARTEYTAEVHVSIPWWPDSRESFEIHVAQPWQPGPADKPLLFSSDPGGPKAREAHVEGSLAGLVFEPGAVVSGALALNNVKWNDYRSIEVGLVAIETITLPKHRPVRTELTRYATRLATEDPVEGAAIPFRFRLPQTVPISYRSSLWQLDWFFDVRVGIRWAGDLQLQVQVMLLPATGDASRHAEPARAPPSVGSERVERIWKDVAQELGLLYDSGCLTQRIGAASLQIWRDHRGRAGVFMVGMVAFPSLRLDLRIDPATGLLRLVGGRSFIDAAWDRKHHVEGREQGQVSAVGDALGEVLRAFGATRMTDEVLQVEHRGSGQKHREVLEFCRAVQLLAPAVERARAAVPPPEPMADAEGSWRTLAERLDTSLERARMAVVGTLDGMAAEVITEWSPQGKPLRTLASIAPVVPVASPYHVLLKPGPDGKVTIDAWPLPSGAVQELARQLLADARGLEVSAEWIRLSLSAPILDTTPLLSRLTDLVRLAVLLRPGAGPFR